jgi:hypothetical protein
MAVASSLSPPVLILLILILATASTTKCHSHKRHHHHHAGGANQTPKPTGAAAGSVPHSICLATPHPVSCLAAVAAHPDAAAATKAVEEASTAVSVSLLPPNVLSVVLASLRGALSALTYSVSPALSALSGPAGGPWVASLRRGAAQDCQELHEATLRSLSRSAALLGRNDDGLGLPTARAHLAAALTNKATCLDGLAGASDPHVGDLLACLDDAYRHVSNSLALVARRDAASAGGFAAAVEAGRIHNRRRLLQDDDDDSGDSSSEDNDGDDDGDGDSGNTDQPGAIVITVAKDGTGNFRTVGEAVAAAPNNSATMTVIRVKAGTYEENVEVPIYKTNVALVGEGRETTVVTGSRSAADGWTTFSTATFGNQITTLTTKF